MEDRIPVPRHLLKNHLVIGPADNRIKSTVEMWLLARLNLEFKLGDALSLHQAIISITNKSGLINRYPSTDPRATQVLDQHDNYMSLCCTTGIHYNYQRHAYNIFLYGLTHFFHYNNVKRKLSIKEWFSCFRQPYQIAIMFLNAGYITATLSLLSGLGVLCLIHLWGAILLEAIKHPKHTSGKLLMWQLYHSKPAYKSLIAIPLKIFKRQMIKQYGGFNRMFLIYYGKDSECHDLALYANQN